MKLAFQGGWNGAKLYFMLGLPTETMEDVAGIAELVRSIENLYQRTAAGPAAAPAGTDCQHSPVHPQALHAVPMGRPGGRPESCRSGSSCCATGLSSRSIKYQWHDLATSRLEAILARGDRRLGPVILAAWRRGRTFDAWDECFDLTVWQECLAEAGLDPDFLHGPRPAGDGSFPLVAYRLRRQTGFPAGEYHKALQGRRDTRVPPGLQRLRRASFAGGICHGQQANT